MGRRRDAETADDDEDLHICGCDFEVEEGEATPDDALPAARGGVRASAGIDAEELVDGCDADFNAVAPTSDLELPPARGGVR